MLKASPRRHERKVREGWDIEYNQRNNGHGVGQYYDQNNYGYGSQR
jgi:hypothetical protein